MAQTKLGATTVNTIGNLPAVGESAPGFTLTGTDLKEVNLKNYAGNYISLYPPFYPIGRP